MNILLWHADKATRDMIAFCLETEVGANVHSVSSFSEAVEHFLGDDEVHLMITTNHAETDKLFKYILSTGSEVFVVLLSEETADPSDAYPDIKILAKMKLAQVATKLVPILNHQFRKVLEGLENRDYCRIEPSLLMKVAPLRGDIYIRLSSVKFVKLYKSGATFSKADLEKVTGRKKISSLYIKKTETKEFIEKFKNDLQALLEAPARASNLRPDQTLLKTASEAQEVVHELTRRLGFTEEIREIAQQNVKLTLRAIGTSPKLSQALAISQFKNRNYISSHSIMLSHLTCSIAAQMKWPSDSTFQKLVLASLFHDHMLYEPSQAKVTNKQQLEELKSTAPPEIYATIKTHTIKAAELVRTFKEIPADVDTILLQHHERPDGSGFPAGLRSQQIAPLSAVFIVAHDIIDELVSQKNEFKLDEFLKKNEANYQLGTFRKIFKALTKSETEVDGSDEDGNSTAA